MSNIEITIESINSVGYVCGACGGKPTAISITREYSTRVLTIDFRCHGEQWGCAIDGFAFSKDARKAILELRPFNGGVKLRENQTTFIWRSPIDESQFTTTAMLGALTGADFTYGVGFEPPPPPKPKKPYTIKAIIPGERAINLQGD